MLASKQVVFPGALWITGNKTGYLWGEVVFVLIICIFFTLAACALTPLCSVWLAYCENLVPSDFICFRACIHMFLRVTIQKIPDWTALSGTIGFHQKNNWEKKKKQQHPMPLFSHSSLKSALQHTHTLTGREITALSQRKWFTKANLNTDVSDRSTLDFLWDKRRGVSACLIFRPPNMMRGPKYLLWSLHKPLFSGSSTQPN